MRYKSRNYFIDALKAETLAKKYSTPLYCYSFKKLRNNILNFKKSFKPINPIICFAVKANSNRAILREIGRLGLGADVVSLGELIAALRSGIKTNKIVFSGVGKTEDELKYAIKKKYC